MITQIGNFLNILKNNFHEIKILNIGPRLGAGAIGTVYQDENDSNYIFKKIILCDNKIRKTCKFIKNPVFASLLDRNIHYNFCDSIVIETLFPLMYNKNKLRTIPDFIASSDSYKIIEEDKNISLYIRSKKYEKLNYINKPEWIIEFFLKIMINIYYLQSNFEFTHYDLHFGNIMKCNKKININLNNIIFLNFSEGEWPTIIDFGDCVFTLFHDDNTFTKYINLNNELINGYNFNEYYDGLTILKSMYTIDINSNFNNTELYKKIFNCFIKNNIESFFYDFPDAYKPNLDVINSSQENLYKPIEIINNLLHSFDYNFLLNKSETTISLIIKPLEFPNTEKITNQIIKDNIKINKFYYLFYKGLFNNKKINCEVISEIYSQNIFSFSLFVTNTAIESIYAFRANIENIELGMGKSGNDVFYRHYLGKQIEQTLSLINNSQIRSGTDGYALNQWNDFGVLLLYDKYVLELPMMIYVEEFKQYLPWSNSTFNYINIDRIQLANDHNSKIINISEKYNWGSVKDYILYVFNYPGILKNKSDKEKIGLYMYNFGNEYIKEYNSTKIPGLTFENTIGMIGSIIRFLPLQDNFFNTVLFRDAHSTMPNRNNTYDREWYDTWLTTNKKFWFYSGAFYNPPHGYNLKTGFAAAWGARKLDYNRPILEIEEYTEYLGFEEIDEEKFYGKSNYGVDERVMYKFYNNSNCLSNSYIVGVTHMEYLIFGQDNPRIDSFLNNFPFNYIPSSESKELEFNDISHLPYEDQQNVYCRPAGFIIRPYSFYVDLRCSFLYSIQMISRILKKNIKDLKYGEYYDILENILKENTNEGKPYEFFTKKNLKMLPPRYNIWQFLFINPYEIDENGIIDRNNINMGNELLLDSNFCKMNKYLWTGNIFNFDKILTNEISIDSIETIKLPEKYPSHREIEYTYGDIETIDLGKDQKEIFEEF